MSVQLAAFSDESNRRGHHYLCVTVVAKSDIGQAAEVMRKLRPVGASEIHMVDQWNEHGKQIMAGMANDLPESLTNTAYLVRGSKESMARRVMLQRATEELQRRGVERWELDQRSSAKADQTAIAQARAPYPPLRFKHVRSGDQPMLWVPDVMAWAVGKGGVWRRLANQVGVEVVQLKP